MAKGLIDDSVLSDIANAIRSKDGSTAAMLPGAMAGKISNISTTPKTKTGTFTPTNNDTATKNITVSNVGFQPKHVVIYVNPSSVYNDPGASSGRYTYFVQYGFASNLLNCSPYTDGTEYVRIRTDPNPTPTVTLTTNGFKITKGYFLLTQYRYIAIG